MGFRPRRPWFSRLQLDIPTDTAFTVALPTLSIDVRLFALRRASPDLSSQLTAY